jgi:hypothetical protein
MKAYRVEATDFSPEVILDPKNNTFEISGISRPENANEFYEPIVGWLEKYINDPNKLTEFKFRFDYFNTSSLKFFLMILSKCKEINESDAELVIKWYHDSEDESMLEAGKSLEELSELKFDFVVNE